MDIELQLRELLVLKDPGARFTDGVMSRVGNVPADLPRAGVVRLADARARKRGRRILLGTLVVVGAAAASMLPLVLRSRADTPVVQETSLAGESSPIDSALPGQGVADSSGTGPATLECIDPDVLRGLLLQSPDQTLRISNVAPAELADFRMPRQFTWVGGTERSMGRAALSSVSAVYRTSLAPEAARTATAALLTASGWTLHSGNQTFGTNVFMGTFPQSGETYCRDGKPVNLTANALDGVTYVVLSASRGADTEAGYTSACDQSPLFFRPPSELDQYMPKLELPRDPVTRQPVPMGSSGGGSGDVERRMDVSFRLKDSLDNVANHFARQMAEQNWNSETSWSGAGTAGSTWTRRLDASTVLHAALMVSAFDRDQFTVVFHVVRTK